MTRIKKIISLLVLTLIFTSTISGQAFAIDNKTVKFISVDAGQWFTIALKSDGTVISSEKPKMIKGLSDIITIAAGSGHSLALDKDGTVWAWGDNMFGQLGTGRVLTISDPIQVGISK